jgi:integrase
VESEDAETTKLLAFMTLLALNALRIGEALSRDIDDLTYDFGHLVLELACKGGKRSTEALAPATARALEAYIGKRTSGPIFLDRKGGRTTEPTPGAWCGASPAEPASPPPIG